MWDLLAEEEEDGPEHDDDGGGVERGWSAVRVNGQTANQMTNTIAEAVVDTVHDALHSGQWDRRYRDGRVLTHGHPRERVRYTCTYHHTSIHYRIDLRPTAAPSHFDLWPHGQCLLTACHTRVHVNIHFGVDSSSSFPFKERSRSRIWPDLISSELNRIEVDIGPCPVQFSLDQIKWGQVRWDEWHECAPLRAQTDRQSKIGETQLTTVQCDATDPVWSVRAARSTGFWWTRRRPAVVRSRIDRGTWLRHGRAVGWSSRRRSKRRTQTHTRPRHSLPASAC